MSAPDPFWEEDFLSRRLATSPLSQFQVGPGITELHDESYEVNAVWRQAAQQRALLRDELHAFVLSRQRNHPPAASIDTQSRTSLVYSKTHPGEARVFELLPGQDSDSLEGQLHHVNIDFAYSQQNMFSPEGSVKLKGGISFIPYTKFAVSLPMKKRVYYTALSYVWGSSDRTCSVDILSNQVRITATVDCILRKLRQPLKPVFLWIDQLCIDQDDLADRESQVAQMAAIYRRAFNTLVWLCDDPDCGALSCLQRLYEATVGYEADLLDEELEDLKDKETFNSLARLLESVWFRRTWIVQEVVVSVDSHILVGDDTMSWIVFTKFCSGIRDIPFFRSQPNSEGGLRMANSLEESRLSFFQLPYLFSLIQWLIATRYAAVTLPIDKVYAVLGMSTSKLIPEYSKTQEQVFREATVEAFEEASGDPYRCAKILGCCDHDLNEHGMPSWVPDWSRPRQTTGLAADLAYRARGGAGRVAPYTVCAVQANGVHLAMTAKFVDDIAEMSATFTNTELTASDATEANRSLKDAVAFVNGCETPQRHENPFHNFCSTVVAGRDGTSKQKYPEGYLEILSLLSDSVTGKSPSLPGQAYTQRQRKGYFTLQNLTRRNPGRLFADFKIAYSKALLDRRLCWTTDGYLGLVPRYADVGDSIVVVPGCSMPSVLRRKQDGQYVFIGECYVDDLMDGEYMKRYGEEVEPVTIV